MSIRRLTDQALGGAAAGGVAGNVLALASTGHYTPASNLKYDPRFAAYNLWENPLASWRNAYAAQKNGERQAKILLAGDSITARDGSGSQVYASCTGGRFRTLMDARIGSSTGTGLIGGQFTSGPTLTYAGAWTNTPSTGMSWAYTNTATDTATIGFTAGAAGTLRIFTADSATGSCTTTLDAVASTTISSTGGGTVRVTDIAVAASGAHTFVMTNASGRLAIYGFEFFTSATSGVRISNPSNTGYSISALAASGLGFGMPMVTAYAPDLLLVPLGTNDVTSQGRTDLQMIADATTLATWCAANHCSMVLLVPPFDSSSTRCRTDWYAVADAFPNTVCVIDQNKRVANDLTGMSGDGTHPTNRGNYELAGNLYNVVTSQLAF